MLHHAGRFPPQPGHLLQMNILFLIPDQLRADWSGIHPALPLRTPHLDALRARGTTFTNAITPSPLCAPARACLATGRSYGKCGVRNNGDDLPATLPTFYQHLRQHGYHVMGCGKFDLHKASYIWNVDGKNQLATWGFDDGIDNEGKIDAILSGSETPKGPYMAFLEHHGWRERHIADMEMRRQDKYATAPTPLPDWAYCDNWIGDNALELLDRAPAGKPWFLQVNFTGPHNPWDITEKMASWYAGVRFPEPVCAGEAPTAVHQAIRANYAAMIENIDRLIGRLVAEISARGELDETLIVFASDHGEMLGDHDRWGKVVPFQPSLAVPLVLAGPGIPSQARHEAPATLLDLPATLLDYAGADPLPDADSRSLRPVLETGAAERRFVTAALNDWQAIIADGHKLIEYSDGRRLLFDLVRDPHESQNLASAKTATVRHLQALLHPKPPPL